MAYLWHSRLGHLSEKMLANLCKKGFLSNLRSIDLEFCEHCVFGKQHQHAFGVGIQHSDKILAYIHSDVWGPSPTTSNSGCLYYVSFIDDYLRYVWIYFMHLKSDAFAIFKMWKAQVESQTGNKVKTLDTRVRCLRSDNGGEYTFDIFEAYYKEQGITRHLTIVYTPQQNGVAERLNRTLLERTRSMLSQSGLPHEFWAKVVNTAAYLVNLSPSSAINYVTSFEMRYKRPADYRGLVVFGCDAYPLIPKETRSKLDATSKKCIFLGCQKGYRGYRLWDPTTCKLIVSRDISFNEPRSSKEGEKAQTPHNDKGKSPLDIVEREIDHDSFHDDPQEDAPRVELVPELQ